MARKIRRLERVIDAPRLFAVAYDEMGSSVYFALGIIAASALGWTPVLVLAAGLLVLLVSLSYAEASAAIPESGGAATFVRRATSDFFGFLTGWAVLLDYLIVISLASVFIPHYVGSALGIERLRESPWDWLIGIGVIGAVTLVRLVRRTRMHTGLLVVAIADIAVQVLLVVLGFVFLFAPGVLADGLTLGEGLTWGDLAFAVPLAFLAYTGLETVANLAGEATEPGTTLPRSMFAAIGLVVAVTTLVALIAMSAFPAVAGETDLGTTWLEAPLVGVAVALGQELPGPFADVPRVVVGLSGAFILFSAVATSMSGCLRITRVMGEHLELPRAFGRLDRRSGVPRAGIVATALVAISIVAITSIRGGEDWATGIASLYSFGVLLAFTAAQLAVVSLRRTEPDLERPFRIRGEITIRGVAYPLPALVGAVLTGAVFVVALITHPGALYAGPAWLAFGMLVYLATRWWEERGLLEEIEPVVELPPPVEYERLLVPMKLGSVGEEMVATAIALAKERDAEVQAVTVVKVPLAHPLDVELPPSVQEQAEASMEEARLLGEDHGVVVETDVVRARSIGHAIVDEAVRRDVDLIVLGSAARWRRQSRFFSPTVDHVLRHAPCEVLVVAFPEGVLEEAATEAMDDRGSEAG